MTQVITHGAWRAALSDDVQAAAYTVGDWLEWSWPLETAGTISGRSRVVVEVFRATSGITPRALVGGELALAGRDSLKVRVAQSSSAMTLGAEKTCPSKFAGSLVPGLPSEFAQATLDGLVRVPANWPSGGLLVVDRGAYDEVESSSLAFEIASGLLVLSLLAELNGTKLDASSLARVSS
ncbi:MAG TPA: hypothetical protein VFU43_14085 [Streptosporangiaceae bacterium]|nr:hypothetical protein [Streptosporangiaceae bacterium]